MDDWLLINSAPRDGTPILLWRPIISATSMTHHIIGWWRSGVWSSRGGPIIHYPSHWMPLPEPPKMPITIKIDREVDGRWIAEILEVPGALAYGATEEEAQEKAIAIAEEALREIGPALSAAQKE